MSYKVNRGLKVMCNTASCDRYRLPRMRNFLADKAFECHRCAGPMVKFKGEQQRRKDARAASDLAELEQA